MRFREDRLRELLRSKTPPWTLGQLHVQARRFRPTLAWRTLSEVVNGKRQPTIEVVGTLAQALDVDPSYLLDLPDEKGNAEFEIIEGRAELAPEVEDLAQELNDLPAGLRERFAALVRELLDLAQGPDESAEDEEIRQLVRLLDNLPPERRAHWQRLIEAEAAGPGSREATV